MASATTFPAEAPVVETPRAILRPLRQAEFETYAAIWADPIVTRYIGGRPHSRDEAWGRFLRHAGHWTVMGYGFWGVEDRETGRLVGEVGFHDLKRDIRPSIEGVPEAGWALVPEMHGRGLATEVVGAMLGWIDAALAPARTVCIINEEHALSERVAEKCGFRRFAVTTYRDTPTLVMERPLPTG